MSKSRNIADLGSNDVIETSATGVDVTGTVTADGLTLQTSEDVLSWASGNGIIQAPANVYMRSSGTGDVILQSDSKQVATFNNGGDVSFYEDTGTTARMTWSSSTEDLSIVDGTAGGTFTDAEGVRGSTNGLNTQLQLYKAGGNDSGISLASGSSGSAAVGLYANKSGTSQADFIIRQDTGSGTSKETFRITDSGNVGIGTASPSAKLEIASGTIKTTPVYSTGNFFKAFHSAPSAGGDGGLYMGAISPNNSDISSGGYYYSGGNYIAKDTTASKINLSNNGIIFSYNSGLTSGSTYAPSERARIDSSGNLLVGRTSQLGSNSKLTLECNAAVDDGLTLNDSYTGAGSAVSINFYRNSTKVGSITNTTSSVAYNTTSDERLKENIVDTTHSVNIDDIKVREYDWKVDGEHQRFGFIAQELETVYPEAVHSPEDPEEMKSVDYSKLVPLLVKEIQTLKARIEELEK
jgi:hypothetical protein